MNFNTVEKLQFTVRLIDDKTKNNKNIEMIENIRINIRKSGAKHKPKLNDKQIQKCEHLKVHGDGRSSPLLFVTGS